MLSKPPTPTSEKARALDVSAATSVQRWAIMSRRSAWVRDVDAILEAAEWLLGCRGG
jgi:hypothetical protein